MGKLLVAFLTVRSLNVVIALYVSLTMVASSWQEQQPLDTGQGTTS